MKEDQFSKEALQCPPILCNIYEYMDDHNMWISNFSSSFILINYRINVLIWHIYQKGCFSYYAGLCSICLDESNF